MTVSVRKVERVYHETGVGQSDRTEVHYELGDEIDGTWVPFASVSEGRVSDYAQRAERLAELEAAKKKSEPAAASK
jgi:hypothetical protein